MIGLGMDPFFFDGFNIFDLVIVLMSSIDSILKIILLATPNNTSANNGSGSGSIHDLLSALRAFRLLRVFKLARTWK